MGLKCGIVGLPNVGKSTLFNALTSTRSAEAQNYPFCTIEPNVGRIGVPDERLDRLAEVAGSAKIIPTQLDIVDIAGLVKGASQGEGLGNQFLGHIRETSAIMHVLRCFASHDITHVEGTVDPVRDLLIVETELMLADLESVNKRITNLDKKIRSGDKEAKRDQDLLKNIQGLLEEGIPARRYQRSSEVDAVLKTFQLLTDKPIVYVCNVGEHESLTGNVHTEAVKHYFKDTYHERMVIVSAAIEAEISQLSESDKKEFLESLGLYETGLKRIAREGYALLDLLTFFTVGPKEAHAWDLQRGLKAPQAAGVIHSDFEKGFICTETISYDDYVGHGGEQGAKAAGKMRLEGREYVVQDGDVFHFRFNV